MKSTTVYRRFYTTEAAGAAVTVDLRPGFGTPKACLLYFVENSAANDAFDETLQFRTLGIGMIGSTDSSITSTLTYRSSFITQLDNVASSGSTIYRRQNSISRYLYVPNTAGAIFWQASVASFSTDRATFTITSSTPQTNGHLDCIMTFFGGDDLIVGIGDSSFAGSAAGTRSYSRLSFQPDVVLVASTITARDAGVQDDCRLAFGAATRLPALQKGVYWHAELGLGGNADLGAISSSNTIVYNGTNHSVGYQTETIGSITTGGWTFTSSSTNTATNNAYNFMALKTNSPTDFALVDLSTNTTTGNVFTGLGSSGFIPDVVIGAATNCSVDNTRDTNSPGCDTISLFAGNQTNHSVFYNGTGTITTSTANQSVTGVSTEFLRFAPGYILYQTDGTLIGTVSTVASKTSLTFVANSAATLSGVSYLYTQPGQYCASFGASDRATTTQVFSGVATTFTAFARGFGASTTRIELGQMSDFDSRPGFNVNTTLTSGTTRLGWALAIKSETENRRRGGIF